jgi:hypothetical protein
MTDAVQVPGAGALNTCLAGSQQYRSRVATHPHQLALGDGRFASRWPYSGVPTTIGGEHGLG